MQSRKQPQKKIKLGDNLMVDLRDLGKSLLTLDTETGEVIFFEKKSAKVVYALFKAEAAGLTLPELAQKTGIGLETTRKILTQLAAGRVIEGFSTKSKASKTSPSGSGLLGALGFGAVVMLAPGSAHAMDCSGPPNCTSQSGVCVPAAPGGFFCSMPSGRFACVASCS